MTFNVLLIRPCSLTGNVFRRVSGVMPPLNLAYLAGYLKKKATMSNLALDVSILDLELEPLSLADLKKRLATSRPDLIGFTVHTNSIPAVVTLSKLIKKVLPEGRIVLGGPHPTVEPAKTLLAAPQFDFIICNEGEQTLYELVVKLVNGENDFGNVLGLCFRNPGSGDVTCSEDRAFIEDLHEIGSPAIEMLDYDKYLNIPQSPGIWKKTVNVFTQRGCPYNCAFCASPVINRRTVRFFPLIDVIHEIKYLKERYDVKHVTFRDSNFTLDRKRCITICLEIIRQKLDITWNCETRVNLVDKMLLKIMKAAGCIKISFGVESGSPRILIKIQKGITIQAVKNAFQWCKEVGIQTQAYFMAGYPTEELRDIHATMALIKTIKPDFLFVSLVVPLPGTKIFSEFKENDLILNPDRYEAFQFFFQEPSWKTLHFTVKDLVKIQRRMYSNYVLSPSYLVRMVGQIRSFSQLKYYFNSILGFFEFLNKRR